MKAVLCRAFGPPESLSFEEVDAPTVGPDEVLVDVRAAALNFPDVLMIEGKYQSRPPFPFSPGGEFAGVVAQVGTTVTGLTPGTRVFGGSGHGAFVEQIAMPAKALRRIPPTIETTTVRTFIVRSSESTCGERAPLTSDCPDRNRRATPRPRPT